MKKIVFVLSYLSFATIVYADNQIYAVQVLKAKQYENAVNFYLQLKDHQDVRIEKINDAFVVRVGIHQTKTKALSLLKQLKQTHTDAFLIKYDIEKRNIVQGKYPHNDHQKTQKIPAIPSINRMANDSDGLPTPPSADTPISVVGQSAELTKAIDDAKQTSQIPKKLQEILKQPMGTEEDFLKEGMQSYHDGKHENTVSLLSKYVSLAPKSKQRGAALLLIGKSFEQMKRPKSALDIYGRIIEQYPDSLESLFSIVAMADISVTNPGSHYPIGKTGAEYVKNPVSAYDTVLLKNVPAPMIEHIQYQKGLALWKLKHYEQARQTQADFLKKFPNTAYHKDVIRMLKDSTAVLINKYSDLEDHVSVANLFFQGWKNGLITTEDVDTLLKSSSSLFYLGLHDDSLKILNTLKKSAMGKASADIDKAVAEIEKKKAIGLMDYLPSDAKWNKFQTGREYLSANNLTNAEQTFSELKKSDGDPFWSKITEYALDENRWIQKYRWPAEK
ncbi:MAG: tetratricopeptide repeat protein [Deltaproteobacteria bacterium]|nr:tetratricopeptide repeat protein [Deltaproteobacteria bacterium]